MNTQGFCGTLPNTPICVDCFKQHANISLYFLSHFHSDHYMGLSSYWRGGTIYCSEVTRGLLLHKFKLLPTSVVVLEVMATQCLRISSSETVNVTAFPANHCPGSVMYLFDGKFGKYFYTGDFRFTPMMNEIIPKGEIDRLFLDTTFCAPQWVFPTRDESIAQIINLINKHNSQIKVYLECEAIFSSIAQEFSAQIYVDKNKFEELSIIPDLAQYLTTDPSSTRFHVCRHMTLSSSSVSVSSLQYVASYQFKAKARSSKLREKLETSAEEEVLRIKPSVQWFRAQGAAAPAKYINQPAKADGIWHVMFSIHSSFAELVSFVNLLSPKSVTPITSIDRAGFNKLVELTHTNVLYLNEKANKDRVNISRVSHNNNNKVKEPVAPQPLPPIPPHKPLSTSNFKNWNSVKPRIPKKAKIEPIMTQSQDLGEAVPIIPSALEDQKDEQPKNMSESEEHDPPDDSSPELESQWPPFKFTGYHSSEYRSSDEEDIEDVPCATNASTNPKESIQKQDIGDLPTQDSPHSPVPIYVASSDSDTTDDEKSDPDRTPETIAYDDDDATPPLAVTSITASESDSIQTTPVIPVPPEKEIIQITSTATPSTKAELPIVPTPILAPSLHESRANAIDDLLKQCNWDSDFELSDDEKTQVASPQKPSKPAVAKIDIKQPEFTMRRTASDQEATMKVEGDSSEEEVWSQTKKKKFRFSFPG